MPAGAVVGALCAVVGALATVGAMFLWREGAPSASPRQVEKRVSCCPCSQMGRLSDTRSSDRESCSSSSSAIVQGSEV